MIAANSVSNYMDFAGLANLKGRAAEGDPESLQAAARQFEALFVQMMLKSMRDAGAIFGESGEQSYRQMFDQQIAIDLAEHQGLGIAELLLRQINPGQPSPSA